MLFETCIFKKSFQILGISSPPSPASVKVPFRGEIHKEHVVYCFFEFAYCVFAYLCVHIQAALANTPLAGFTMGFLAADVGAPARFSNGGDGFGFKCLNPWNVGFESSVPRSPEFRIQAFLYLGCGSFSSNRSLTVGVLAP